MIELSRIHAEMIVWHAQAEAPLEACGLLSGRGTSVLRVFPLQNEDRSEVSYHLNPEEQFRIFMEIEEVGDQLVGIYHSHPKTAAYPSPRDIEAAYYPRNRLSDRLAGRGNVAGPARLSHPKRNRKGRADTVDSR